MPQPLGRYVASAWSALLLLAMSAALLAAVAGFVIAFAATDDADYLASHLGFGGLLLFLALGPVWLLGLALMSPETIAAPLWAARALRRWKSTVFGLLLFSGVTALIGVIVALFEDEDTFIPLGAVIAFVGLWGVGACGLTLLLARAFWTHALGELADGPGVAGVKELD